MKFDGTCRPIPCCHQQTVLLLQRKHTEADHLWRSRRGGGLGHSPVERQILRWIPSSSDHQQGQLVIWSGGSHWSIGECCHVCHIVLNFWHQMQGRSQPHSLGWARVSLSSFFPQISINFSSNFTYFLPHFGSPGGRVAQPGRPWLRHWVDDGEKLCQMPSRSPRGWH